MTSYCPMHCSRRRLLRCLPITPANPRDETSFLSLSLSPRRESLGAGEKGKGGDWIDHRSRQVKITRTRGVAGIFAAAEARLCLGSGEN